MTWLERGTVVPEDMNITDNYCGTMWDFKFSRRRVWCSELSSGLYCRVEWLSTIFLHGSITQKTVLNIILRYCLSSIALLLVEANRSAFHTQHYGLQWFVLKPVLRVGNVGVVSSKIILTVLKRASLKPEISVVSIKLHIYPPNSLFIRLSIYLFSLSICLIYPTIHPSVLQSIYSYLCIHSLAHLFIHLSIYLFTYLPTYLIYPCLFYLPIT
jgi:hypothetical protein